jgi:RND family efflux transporter MFP subunit
VDERTGEAAAKRAAVEAAAANVRRLVAMQGFKKLTAPFDGVVTARKTDIGALINAGSGSGPELFKVADVHKMRVYVRVPQALAAGLQNGIHAALKLPQYANRTFDAVLTNSSIAVSKDSRSLLVELQADNKDGLLWPGTFAEVHFNLPDDPHILHIPTSALLFRKEGMEVATGGADGKIVLKPVELGRDLGTEVEIRMGLDKDDKVVDSPSDSIAQGDTVHITDASHPSAAKAEAGHEGSGGEE